MKLQDLTPEQIERRAEELARERWPGAEHSSAVSDNALHNSWKWATILRLQHSKECIPYMQHKWDCSTVLPHGATPFRYGKRECDCGLTSLIKKLATELGAEP